MINKNYPCAKQNGVVLILMILVLASIVVGTMLSAVNPNSYRLRLQNQTQQELMLAKQKFLAYATLSDIYSINTDIGPGHMVCPDINGNGEPEASCSVGIVGRLPLQLQLISGSGVYSFDVPVIGDRGKFWYAIANDYRDDSAGVVNTTTLGALTFDSEIDIVAVIIAPGEALERQNRDNNVASNYLEKSNSSGLNFVQGVHNSEEINDQVISISRRELMTNVTSRIAGLIKANLDTIYPVNANSYITQNEFENLSLGTWPTWFSANKWQLPATTTYNQVSTDLIELTFNNCNITFTIDINLPKINTRPTVAGRPSGC